MSGLKIVTVVNNFEIFERCIKNNESLRDFEIVAFDNTVENIGIPQRYNTFINNLTPQDDFWVVFIHQDFMFNENPIEKLKNLNRGCVYGAVGVSRRLFYLQFKPQFIFKVYRRARCLLGQIFQGEEDYLVGMKAAGTPKVKTLDCCCCIVHSSLIMNKNLRFDENLKFHMYVEDFCINASLQKIDTRIVQFNCRHLSGGNPNQELIDSAEYLKAKYKISCINSTCFK